MFVTSACLVSADDAPTSQKDKKNVKRGTLDDFGYPLGYNGWASSLKISGPSTHLSDKFNIFSPSQYDLAHIIAAAKQAAQDVYLAQQYVSAAKEDVLFQQKLVKEREAHALIAAQKNEAAQNLLRMEAQNVVLSQQKLAKAKAHAAELQLKQAIKDAEAARAIQSSASHANTQIQKANNAAKISSLKQSIASKYPPSQFSDAGPWNSSPSSAWSPSFYSKYPHSDSPY